MNMSKLIVTRPIGTGVSENSTPTKPHARVVIFEDDTTAFTNNINIKYATVHMKKQVDPITT